MAPPRSLRGRRAAVCSLLALIGVLALAARFWPEAVAEYHALRLRADPELLARAIEERGSPGRERGLRRLLDRNAGRRALLDLFIRRFQEGRPSFAADLAGSSRLLLTLGEDWLQLVRWNQAEVMSGSVSSLDRARGSPDRRYSDPRRWEEIAARLGTLEGAEIRSASHPRWTFTVHPREIGPGREPRKLRLTATRAPP